MEHWRTGLTMVGGNAVYSTLLMILLATVGCGDELLEVEPARVSIRGADGRSQLVATARSADGKSVDVTTSVRYLSSNTAVARVDKTGLIRPIGDGNAVVEVILGDRIWHAPVEVTGIANPRPVRFVTEIAPIFSKFGCNAGGCHGKSGGQNGFRLSLLGSDPKADFESLVNEGRGRRVFPASPEASLLLKKPTALIPHGGGKRFTIDSPEYSTLARWIGQGMPFRKEGDAELIRVSVEPSRRVIARGGRQQLHVLAHYSDGSSDDVTRLAQYQTNAPELADVDDKGVIHILGRVGEAAIMARFGGLVGVARATVPSGADRLTWNAPASRNFIDPLIFGKLRELGLEPSEDCTDADFARRSSLDICGILPSPLEVIELEKSTNPAKRIMWVDRLLARPEYADFFALKWSSLLKVKRALGPISQPGTFAFHAWIRQSLAENKPYDQFVAEIVSARGDVTINPPVLWTRQAASAEDRADDTAQLFLGVRIQCARCHHHPSEKWSQDDYYGFASLFSRVGTKPGADPTSPLIYNLPAGLATNPMTGEARPPKPLGAPELGELGRYRDPRVELASWLRRPDNSFLARAVVNRYWKHFLGRGLVEPEDDFRASNPPTNPELLEALAADFIASGYDLKHLVRTIATSRAYDRSSLPNASNESDRQNFARFTARRLPAEVLLDAVGVVTGVPETFAGVPPGFRAIQLPDDGFASDFLDVFGRPKRESVCECERSSEANLAQTLHLLNAEGIQAKLHGQNSNAAKLAMDGRPDGDKIEGLYRLAFSRPPSAVELGECVAFLEKRQAVGRLRDGYEDLIWTLINTKEFLFNH